MRVTLAWSNITHHRKRFLAATMGIAVAALLIFVQLLFLQTVRTTASLVFRTFEFDLILVSFDYEYMNESGMVPMTHLAQAGQTPGVRAILPLFMNIGDWENLETLEHSEVMILGMRPDPGFLRDGPAKTALPTLALPGRMIVDELSHPDFGSLAKERRFKLNGVEMTLSGLFRMGSHFYGDGTVLVSDMSYRKLQRRSGPWPRFGLVRLDAGADPREVMGKLVASLPRDVKVFDRKTFLDMEENYFVTVMPIGQLMMTGVLVVFLVGAIELFQVIWTDISDRLDEFATMKAAGFSSSYIHTVGLLESILLSLVSYGGAWVLASLFVFLAGWLTRLPIHMSGKVAFQVMLLSLGMCVLSGVAALYPLRNADPADLFRKKT